MKVGTIYATKNNKHYKVVEITSYKIRLEYENKLIWSSISHFKYMINSGQLVETGFK